MRVWLGQLFACWVRFLQGLRQMFQSRGRPRRRAHHHLSSASRRVVAPPKPTWVRDEVIRLKALMPEAGCRTIAHHFNRRCGTQADDREQDVCGGHLSQAPVPDL